MIVTAKEAAEILREDAEDCWGIRRKLNLRAAANIIDDLSARLARAEAQLAEVSP